MMHQAVKAAIEWAVAAAKEHVDICTHTGETPDPEGGMGLWQSFQAAFPKAGYPGHNYDLLITAYSTAYSETVKAIQSVLESAQQAQAKQELAWERELLGLDKPEEG